MWIAQQETSRDPTPSHRLCVRAENVHSTCSVASAPGQGRQRRKKSQRMGTDRSNSAVSKPDQRRPSGRNKAPLSQGKKGSATCRTCSKHPDRQRSQREKGIPDSLLEDEMRELPLLKGSGSKVKIARKQRTAGPSALPKRQSK